MFNVPNMGIRHVCAPSVLKFFKIVFNNFVGNLICMNAQSAEKKEKEEDNEIERLSRCVPVLSEYAASLESHVKLRYLKKISIL